MPNAGEVRALFRAFLREGRKFNSYNIREYILRRAKEGFRENRAAAASAAETLVAHAQEELAVVQRQSMVYQLYGRHAKSILELTPKSMMDPPPPHTAV